MNIKKLIPILLIIPNITFADEGKITDIIDSAFAIVTDILIPLTFGLCVIYFFWGLANYIRAGAGGEEAAKKGKKIMIWGTVGIFIAFSIWGIISFIQVELGVDPIMDIKIPPIEKT